MKIEIPETQGRLYLEFLKTQEQSTVQEIQRLNEILSGIRGTMQTIATTLGSGEVDTPSITPVETTSYNKTWTQTQKVQFIMKKLGRPVGTGELADIIIRDYEPELDRRKAVSNISGVLTNKDGRGKFAKSIDVRNQPVYSLIYR